MFKVDQTERIESVRLLDVLQYTSHDDVVIIKIDVEGHECKVIVQMCLCLSFFVSLCPCLCLFSFSALKRDKWSDRAMAKFKFATRVHY